MTPELTKLGPLTVSRLGFGTLSLSPLQSSLVVDQGADLLCYAWHQGIRFWDTAQIYENYPVLRRALRQLSQPPVIATKTYAWSGDQAKSAFDEARRELDLEVIDIMMLHEQTALTLPGHQPALDWMVRAREKGLIRAIGVSTHSVACVQAAAKIQELDIIHPLYNKWGVGIHDGSPQDMAAAIVQAKARGKGIYGMKILGGGTKFRQATEAITHALEQPWLDSAVIGMSSREEVDYNLALFQGRQPDPKTADLVGKRSRRLYIAQWCEGCGDCLESCGQNALRLESGKVVVETQLCLLCGYCSRRCVHMCLKII